MNAYHLLSKQALEVRPLSTGGSILTGGSAGAIGGGALGVTAGLGKALLDSEDDTLASTIIKALKGGAIGAVGGGVVGGIAGHRQKNNVIDAVKDESDILADDIASRMPARDMSDRQLNDMKRQLRDKIDTRAPEMQSGWKDAVRMLMAGRGGVEKEFAAAKKKLYASADV